MTKAALLMLSKTMSTEFIPLNIRVNTVNPGLILTPDWVKTAKQLTENGDWEGYLQGVADEHAPIKRFGTVEELADFMVFLCSAPRLLRRRRHLLLRRRHAPHNLRRPPMATPLSLATLDTLPAGVARPTYARSDLSPGILHFGVGNFHRAHLQVYLDRLMNAGRDRDWAIVGAGVTPYDAGCATRLAGQDLLSTVVEQSAATSSARVTGVMTDFLPPMDGEAIVAALADPAIRIVSLTVTEGGYFVNPATGRLRPREPGDRRRRRATPTIPRPSSA